MPHTRHERLAEFLAPTCEGGDSSRFHIAIEAIVLADGSEIKVQEPGVTAIVGGNNVGKSTVLRHASQLLNLDAGGVFSDWRLVTDVRLRTEGTAADLIAWLDAHANFVVRGTQHGFVRGVSRDTLLRPEWVERTWAAVQETGRLSHPRELFSLHGGCP